MKCGRFEMSCVRLDPVVNEEAKELARKLGWPFSLLVRTAIAEFLERKKKEEKED